MRYRQLGNSSLSVSEIAFGSWLNFSASAAKQNAIDCVHRALSLGINLIDTANVYGRGIAEQVLGEALHGIPRDSYLLATKVYFPMSHTDQGLSRAQLLKQIDASLVRLRTGYVDLYQCHRYDEKTPLEETMQALTDIVRAGKARYIGFSEWPIAPIRTALAMSGVESFVSSQPQYSLLHRGPETSLMPLCQANGISQIVWSPLAQGVLSGKYAPDAPLPPQSRAANDAINGFIEPRWMQPAVLRAVASIGALAQQAGLTLAQFALAWVLRQPNVAAAIVGASRPDQLNENIKASTAQVPAELFAAAEQRLAQALET